MAKKHIAPPALSTELAPIEQRAAVGGGGLEGASRTSREMARWQPVIISPDRQINPQKELMDARSRDITMNDGYLTGAANLHRDSIVGAQFRLNAQPDILVLGAEEAWAEEFQKIVESRFGLTAESPECWLDASGKSTLTGLVRLGVVGAMVTGEILSTAEWLRARNRPCSTAVQLISPSRLSNPDNKADEMNLRRGVVTDFYGAALGHWIRTTHPGEFYSTSSSPTWKYVPATKPWGRRQVIHIFEAMQPGQSRGISDMVSALKDMRMTKKFKEVTLQNAVVNASFAAAVESELPSDVVFSALGGGGQKNGMGDVLSSFMAALAAYVGESNNISIDGTKIPHLFPGTKLKLTPMGTPGGVGTEFEESLLRHIAAALGLSYEQFSRDYTKTNYSSARASMGETFKYMQSRKKVFADRFASAIYRLWLEEEMNAGRIPLPPGMTVADYYSDPLKREALSACDWIGASRGQIDEMKETQAALTRIDGGLSTYEIECARLGTDFRKVFSQRAREEKMKTDAGLVFSSQAAKDAAKNDPNADQNEQDQQPTNSKQA